MSGVRFCPIDVRSESLIRTCFMKRVNQPFLSVSWIYATHRTSAISLPFTCIIYIVTGIPPSLAAGSSRRHPSPCHGVDLSEVLWRPFSWHRSWKVQYTAFAIGAHSSHRCWSHAVLGGLTFSVHTRLPSALKPQCTRTAWWASLCCEHMCFLTSHVNVHKQARNIEGCVHDVRISEMKPVNLQAASLWLRDCVECQENTGKSQPWM